jgi:hypothetical protein
MRCYRSTSKGAEIIAAGEFRDLDSTANPGCEPFFRKGVWLSTLARPNAGETVFVVDVAADVVEPFEYESDSGERTFSVPATILNACCRPVVSNKGSDDVTAADDLGP